MNFNIAMHKSNFTDFLYNYLNHSSPVFFVVGLLNSGKILIDKPQCTHEVD